MSGFRQEESGLCYSAKVDDITLTIGVGGDVLIIEQPGDNIDPDIILLFGKEDAKMFIDLVQEWYNSTFTEDEE